MNDRQTYRNSKQRMRIMELLQGTDSHPTAAWIYDRLKEEFPSLSLGTVYRNLNILEQQGNILKLASGSTFDRYDAVVAPHPHFRCLICGSVHDLKNPEHVHVLKSGDLSSGHLIKEMFIEYRGMCASCVEKESLKRENVSSD